MDIGRKQIELTNRVKNFLTKLEASNINSHLSSICYFTCWAETPGYARLKLWIKGWPYIFKFFFIIIKNILAISTHANYVEVKKQTTSKKYNTLILSWCFKQNFLPDGSITDRYFLENSKDIADAYWILVSMDNYIPHNLNNNITIIKKKGIFKYNFISFFKILITIICKYRFSPRKIFHYIYYHSHLAEQISPIIKKELNQNDYKMFLMPYEAQPFQLNSILEAKKINENIKTVGYIHTVLTPNPCDYIYRKGSPDFLLTHGESNSEILKSQLGWPAKKLILSKSFRYRENKNRSLSKMIFTPYTIHNNKIFIREFKNLIKNSPSEYFPIIDIKMHPPMNWLQEIKHLKLKKELKKIMITYKNRFSKTPQRENISIFFGVTAAIFEALETGVEVIHICSDPIFDSHSPDIWPNLEVKQLSSNVFHYNLKEIGKYIIFGEEKNTLNEVLKKI